MKKVFIPAAVMVLSLAGCASSSAPKSSTPAQGQQGAATPVPATTPAIQVAQVDSIDKTVEVSYKCTSPNGEQKMSAMYGVKDGTLVVAQLKVNNQASPGLWRVLNDANGNSQNSFYGEGLTWITGKASPNDVSRVNANVLLQAQSLDSNGTPVGQQNVLLRDCAVERTAAPARQRGQQQRNNRRRQ
ncbi:MAG: hypothetical protein Q4A62_02595 [Eikenella sp.]|nr:hypothetical protein [Eikenella sp.]